MYGQSTEGADTRQHNEAFGITENNTNISRYTYEL
jgi:hypothetical protein